MSSDKYVYTTLKDLIQKEKKLKRDNTIVNFILGFLVGVLIYGLANKGFGFLHIFLPLVLIMAVYKGSQNLKSNLAHLKNEIETKRKRS